MLDCVGCLIMEKVLRMLPGRSVSVFPADGDDDARDDMNASHLSL